jgi:hypothetical protein
MAEIDSAQARRNNQIIWLTLLASQLIYVAVILSGAARTRTEPFELPVLPIALAVVAVATGIGSHLCWRHAVGAGQPIHSEPPKPARSFTFYMLSWILDGSVAVYGLVLGLLAFSPAAWGPFSLAAFVLIVVHRPS